MKASLLCLLVIPQGALSAPGFLVYNASGPYNTTTLVVRDKPAATTKSIVTYPTNVAPGVKIPILVYAAGTESPAEWYQSTANHIASHGFATMYIGPYAVEVPKASVTWGVEWFHGAAAGGAPLPAPLAGRLDLENIATGGHSGGGLASWSGLLEERAKGRHIKAFIAQHTAGISKIKQNLKDLASIHLCGSKDHVVPCALVNLFYSFRSGPRMRITNPNTHFAGVWRDSGNAFEGGQIVAFLHYTLKNVTSARAALNACPQFLKGKVSVTDDLDHGKISNASVTVVV